MTALCAHAEVPAKVRRLPAIERAAQRWGAAAVWTPPQQSPQMQPASGGKTAGGSDVRVGGRAFPSLAAPSPARGVSITPPNSPPAATLQRGPRAMEKRPDVPFPFPVRRVGSVSVHGR